MNRTLTSARYPHFETDAQVLRVVDADQLDGTQELFEVVKNLHRAAAGSFKDNPRRSDVLREDVAYKLAVVETLQKVLDLPAQARAIREEAAKHKER